MLIYSNDSIKIWSYGFQHDSQLPIKYYNIDEVYELNSTIIIICQKTKGIEMKIWIYDHNNLTLMDGVKSWNIVEYSGRLYHWYHVIKGNYFKSYEYVIDGHYYDHEKFKKSKDFKRSDNEQVIKPTMIYSSSEPKYKFRGFADISVIIE